MDNRTNAHTDPNSPDYCAFLVVGTDPGMSGWGGARGKTSYAAWACPAAMVDDLLTYVSGRRDMTRARCVSAKTYRCPRNGHLSIYVASPDELGMELVFRATSGTWEVWRKDSRNLYVWSPQDCAFRAHVTRERGMSWDWDTAWPALVRELATGARAPMSKAVGSSDSWASWWSDNGAKVLTDLSTEAARLHAEADRLLA